MSGNVKIVKGDIFKSGAQTLVNTVNCVGVMGKGLALEFKNRFPEMYKDYVARCKCGEVKLGRPYLYRSLMPPWIINVPTKAHWRGVSRLEDIVKGLEYLKEHYKEWGITSMAVPALGCSHGQLEWNVVGPTMYRILTQFNIPIEFYVPLDISIGEARRMLEGKLSPREANSLVRIKPAWVALVAILAEVEKEPYHNPVGRTMFQKIAYFATISGLPTELEYRRGSYGPFTEQFKKMLTQLVNNGLVRERSLGRMFEVQVGPSFQDAYNSVADDLKTWTPIIRRVADLFMRVNTQQAEILATVYMVSQELNQRLKSIPSANELVKEVLSWKQKRRPPLNQKRVEEAVTQLAILGWIEVRATKTWIIDEPELID